MTAARVRKSDISRPQSSRPNWSVASEPPPPERIGSFRVLYQLAKGGTSSVFVAELEGDASQVFAIKLLDKRGQDEFGLRSFLAEARVTTSLDHPNVVKALEWGEHEGVPFIAMELVLGASVSELLAALRRHERLLDPWIAAFVIEQAALGLHHAHELRDAAGNPIHLVHRDISPHNILLSFEGRVALSDFGIAKFAARGHTTAKGMLKGRFAYMSPEHVRGDSLDRRSDVFSLGIVLYEALTLQRAMDGKSAGETVLQLLQTERIDPRAVLPDLPASLAEIVTKACANRPEARFQTALEMAEALRRARATASVNDGGARVSSLVNKHFAARLAHFSSMRSDAPSPPPAPSSVAVTPRSQRPKGQLWLLVGVALISALVTSLLLLLLLR